MASFSSEGDGHLSTSTVLYASRLGSGEDLVPHPFQ